MICCQHCVCLVQVCQKRCCSTILDSFQDLCQLCISSCIVCLEEKRPLVPISGFSCGHFGFALRCESVVSLSSFLQFQCGLHSCCFFFQLCQCLHEISRCFFVRCCLSCLLLSVCDKRFQRLICTAHVSLQLLLTAPDSSRWSFDDSTSSNTEPQGFELNHKALLPS